MTFISMPNKSYLAVVGLALLLVGIPVQAHHSFSAEFDLSKPIRVSGTVTKMAWSNPHSWIYLDVKDASGKATNWHFELGSPNALFRAGWKKDSIPVGLEVNIVGYQAKSGDSIGNATGVKLPDGTELLTGGSAPNK